jgi:dTDP-glucose 4,6-dehydratase
MRRALVTGGAGFIGSALSLRLKQTGWKVVVLDALTYAAAPGTASLLEDDGIQLIHGDIRHRDAVRAAYETAQPDVVFHLAAESHVDRSIDQPGDFISTNVNGSFEMLEGARATGRADLVFVHVSTDEVFGSLGPGEAPFTEASRYDPSSPYSASKAASDHLARSWGRTHGLDVRISNCSNNYGPRQFPEKLIPLMALNARAGKSLPVYGDGSNVRDWLHVSDHACALQLIAERGKAGESYCIGGDAERSNIQVVEAICDHLDAVAPGAAPRRKLIEFVTDRPGHDWRYAINAEKARRALGWQPQHDFEAGLALTIDWYLQNEAWLAPLSERYGGDRLGQGGTA